jgi:hypothetical protein
MGINRFLQFSSRANTKGMQKARSEGCVYCTRLGDRHQVEYTFQSFMVNRLLIGYYGL